jgi:hypothetical protein
MGLLFVRDHNGQALAYVYCEDEPGRRSAAKLPTEASDKTKPDRVITDAEDDRNCRCGSLGRERGCVPGAKDEARRVAANVAKLPELLCRSSSTRQLPQSHGSNKPPESCCAPPR